jgi:hypothetical protein
MINQRMNTKHTSRIGRHTVVLALFSCLVAEPLFAQERHYQEAHVCITAPGALPTATPVSPAVEVVRPMLLSNRGFQTFEPLEQPDEHVPTTWNLVCDQEGGPRHAGGTPGRGSGTIVNADTTTGKLSFNPPHYILGQFSRFIRPGAKRIACTSAADEFIATAALNPDGSIAVVVNNLKDKETFFRVWRNGQSLRYTSPPNATLTFLFEPTQ